MISIKHNEFYSHLQRYKFINSRTDEIDPREFDVDDILCNGVPTNEFGEVLDLYGIVEEINESY